MKFGLIYPAEKSEKMRTLRFLKAKNIDHNKITALVEIPENAKALKEGLEKIGNTLIPMEGEIQAPNTIVQKYHILNRLFTQAIREDKKSVINFLLSNLTNEEIELLREEY